MPKRDPFYTTRTWRKFRLLILDRDGWQCQMRGPRCLGAATAVNHILSRVEYPELSMDPNNCEAACQPCNSRDGGHLGVRRRSQQLRAQSVAANDYGAW